MLDFLNDLLWSSVLVIVLIVLGVLFTVVLRSTSVSCRVCSP